MADFKCRISGENLEEFIDLYYNAECLWNIKCKEYRDISARNKAYESMAEILNMPTDLIKKKINNLRSTYVQERKKVDSSKYTGTATDDVYTPSLWWYKKLRFLDDIIVPRKTVSSFEKVSEKRQMLDEIGIHKADVGSQVAKKKKVNTETGFDEALKTFKEICSTETTEFDKFGESVAAQLKSLPTRAALKLQLEIQQLITNKKLELLDDEIPSTSFSPRENYLQERSALSVSNSRPTSRSTTSSPPIRVFSHGSVSKDSSRPTDCAIQNESNVLYAALRSADIIFD